MERLPGGTCSELSSRHCHDHGRGGLESGGASGIGVIGASGSSRSGSCLGVDPRFGNCLSNLLISQSKAAIGCAPFDLNFFDSFGAGVVAVKFRHMRFFGALMSDM